jgi:hypothetical protein
MPTGTKWQLPASAARNQIDGGILSRAVASGIPGALPFVGRTGHNGSNSL